MTVTLDIFLILDVFPHLCYLKISIDGLSSLSESNTMHKYSASVCINTLIGHTFLSFSVMKKGLFSVPKIMLLCRRLL